VKIAGLKMIGQPGGPLNRMARVKFAGAQPIVMMCHPGFCHFRKGIKVIRCQRCLIPITRPDTAFVDGVCSACLSYETNKAVDWAARRDWLVQLLEKQKPNGTGFDCIVASSGGKDSYSQVKALLDLGARPLIVTATTCMLTKVGRLNIDNLKRYAPTIEVTPNQEVRAKLNYLGLSLVGDISWPEHVAIFTTPLRMAASLGIPLVFYGENPQNQYGGPPGTYDAMQMTHRWVTEFGGFLGLRPADMVGQKGITANDMLEYQFPEANALRKSKCQAHFLGQYLGPWDSHANAAIAKEMGMVQICPSARNWWIHENLDNAMTGIHDHMMYRKYGFGRACQQLSVDIRMGRITRDNALRMLPTFESNFLPMQYAGVDIQDVLNHLGIDMPKLTAIVNKFARR
jgi:N-acetyl sugar amidotransferase